MRWFTALIFGAALGLILPTVVDSQSGNWLDSWFGVYTIRVGTGGMLFSIPLWLGSALAARLFFNWHSR